MSNVCLEVNGLIGRHDLEEDDVGKRCISIMEGNRVFTPIGNQSRYFHQTTSITPLYALECIGLALQSRTHLVHFWTSHCPNFSSPLPRSRVFWFPALQILHFRQKSSDTNSKPRTLNFCLSILLLYRRDWALQEPLGCLMTGSC